jgi:replicative DNA helicase
MSDQHDAGLLAARPREPVGFRVQPHSLEAEQALLGAVLVSNEAFHRVGDLLLAEHFYDPSHGRLYQTIATRIGRGQLADAVTLRGLFEEDEGLRELGGAAYLAALVRAAESIVNAPDYARLIHDLALRRGLIQVGEEVVNTAYDRAAEQTGREQIEHAEQQLFQLAQQGEVSGDFRGFPAVLTSTIQLIEAAYKKRGRITGVPTGLTGIDEKLGGLQPSDLVVLAGRPSMGKTALAITMAANAAREQAVGPEAEGLKSPNYTIGVFSLEMSAEQLAMRLLSAEAMIGSDELRRGQLKDRDFGRVVQASQELAARPIYIDDTPALSVPALRTRARRLKRRVGLSLLVVDYLQLMRGVGTVSQTSRVQEIAEITQGLKAIAKELNVAVLALSQLSRAVESREDKRPVLSDLRDSGTIEQDADVVMFVYRDDYYLERREPRPKAGQSQDAFQKEYETWCAAFEAAKNMADVIIAKQRNGPIGSVKLQFDPNFGRFHNFESIDYGDGY